MDFIQDEVRNFVKQTERKIKPDTTRTGQFAMNDANISTTLSGGKNIYVMQRTQGFH
jgi:hypothetical protein